MAKFIVGSGISKYTDNLDNLLFDTGKMVGKMLYEGAKIVTDEVAKNIDALPTQLGRPKKGQQREPSPQEKQGLKDGLGIAKKKIDGTFINVKVGFDGYNSVTTERWPNGVPNALVARSIESGTTFIKRHPFVTQAVKATKAEAEKRMAEIVDEFCKKDMEVR